jgi:hypothetical protein
MKRVHTCAAHLEFVLHVYWSVVVERLENVIGECLILIDYYFSNMLT